MRRAITIVEVVVGLAAAVLLLGVVIGVQHVIGRQTRIASDGLDQAQAAVRLMEMMRLELSGLVMNPTTHPDEHQGNSLLVTQHGNGIQFVTERRERGHVHRYLVSYAAAGSAGSATGLTLAKQVWEFTREEPWTQSVAESGWPSDWIGKAVESRASAFDKLALQDLEFRYLVPEDDAAQVYVRVKLVLKSASGRLMPLTTLVALPTPRLVAGASTCPCVNAACFDPSRPDCACCLGQDDDGPADSADTADTTASEPDPKERPDDTSKDVEEDPE